MHFRNLKCTSLKGLCILIMAHNNNVEDMVAIGLNNNTIQNSLQDGIDEALGNKPASEVSKAAYCITCICNCHETRFL